jgi:hypothetical protein
MSTMNHPHDNEYLAAIAGLHEQTISPRALPAVGDFVSGVSGGRHWSGYVQQIEPRRMVVEVSGAWLVVDPQDITH